MPQELSLWPEHCRGTILIFPSSLLSHRKTALRLQKFLIDHGYNVKNVLPPNPAVEKILGPWS